MTKNHKYTRDSAKFLEAVSYRRLEKIDEAKKIIFEILNNQPDFAPALNEMGKIFTHDGDYDNAISYFKRILDISPDDLDALRGMGIIYRQKGKLEESNECFEKVSNLTRQKLNDELKGSREKLREKEALLIAASNIATANALLTSFAHQINNPLQIMQSVIFRLKNKKQITEDDLRRNLTKIQESTNRIHDLLRHQNKLVRSDPGDNKFVNIRKVILRAFEPFEEQLKDRGIKKNLIDLENKKRVFMVFGNPVKLEQLFINLIANARDALKFVKNPEIKITVEKDQINESDIVIHFSDNGEGLSDENLKRIFNYPFTTKKSCTGLGLLLCYSVINQMNGKIKVDSRLGKGTKFIITLPNKGG